MKKMHLLGVAAAGSVFAGAVAPTAQAQYVNRIATDARLTDSTAAPNVIGANINRVGFYSDLFYDRNANVYYALSDRGPGGGTLDYETRVQKFTLDVNPASGAISNLQLTGTVKFNNGSGTALNGLAPNPVGTLGNSFDPEGFAVAPNGNFYVSDEYGPSVYEFDPSGNRVRSFTVPANLIPRRADNSIDLVSGRGSGATNIVTGRQDNRGYEGLALSPDGTKLYAMLQDPLVNEGTDGDGDLNDGEGRKSRNLRIVEYSTATGDSTAQYIYQLETIASLNNGSATDFGVNAQGRNIGISAIIPLGGTEFLVLERDNRGVGVDNPFSGVDAALSDVRHKKVYKIDLAGATNAQNISLNDTNDLVAAGVTPVSKELFLDLQAELNGAGERIYEKIEGITFGPQLDNGKFLFLAGTDNDYSVTQIAGGSTQFDVYSNADDNNPNTPTRVLYTPIDNIQQSFASTTAGSPNLGSLPFGFELIPGNLYAFQAVPEPTALALLVLAGGPFLLRRTRQR